jgi:hypothetical protein
MRSNILDKFGREVAIGDVIAFPYITPMGRLTEEEDFRAEVKFKYGCYGYDTPTEFIPLMKWMKTEQGGYISNQGHRTVYTEKYPFWVV